MSIRREADKINLCNGSVLPRPQEWDWFVCSGDVCPVNQWTACWLGSVCAADCVTAVLVSPACRTTAVAPRARSAARVTAREVCVSLPAWQTAVRAQAILSAALTCALGESVDVGTLAPVARTTGSAASGECSGGSCCLSNGSSCGSASEVLQWLSAVPPGMSARD